MNQTDTSRAVNLRVQKGLTYQEIGKILGKSKQHIHTTLKKILPDESVEIYKANDADIIAGKELKALAHMTDEKLKKASARDLVIIFGTLYDKRKGLGQVNVSIHALLVDSTASGGPAEPPVIEADKLPDPEPAPPAKKAIHRRKKT